MRNCHHFVTNLLEGESLVEEGVESLTVDFGLKLALLVGQQVDLQAKGGGLEDLYKLYMGLQYIA